jgi:hypothetical protein
MFSMGPATWILAENFCDLSLFDGFSNSSTRDKYTDCRFRLTVRDEGGLLKSVQQKVSSTGEFLLSLLSTLEICCSVDNADETPGTPYLELRGHCEQKNSRAKEAQEEEAVSRYVIE